MTDEETLELFVHQFHRGREAWEKLSNRTLEWKLSVDEQGFQSTLTVPPAKEINRLAAVVAPLADPSSALYYGRVAWTLMVGDPGERHRIQRGLQLLQAGEVLLTVDGQDYRDTDLWLAYAKGEFFSDDEESQSLLAALRSVLGTDHLVQQRFYAHSQRVLRYCGVLYDLCRVELAKAGVVKQRSIDKAGPCIYCRTIEGDFTRPEHVYPESLGNQEIILRNGEVCVACNSGVLSTLDEYLVNNDAIALLRTFLQPNNPRTGKFPNARGKDYRIDKVAPRHVVVGLHSGASEPVVQELGNGMVHMQFELRGRKFELSKLGRALYRIALGFVAWKEGAEAAYNVKYDAARRYILGAAGFPNLLFLSTECVPNPNIRSTYWVRSPGTFVWLEILGLGYCFNLELEPRLDGDNLPPGVAAFSLQGKSAA